MAKKISSSDLFTKEDIFEGIRLSAQKTIEQLNQLDAEFKELANAMQSTLKGATTNTTSGLNTFVQTTQKANSLMEQSIQVVKLKAQAEQQLQKAQQEAEKTAQQKEKTAQAEIRTKQQQAKETERQARAQEKATRTAQNEANAYKRLEKNTRDLKNESKRLGAEMLALERAGKKNTIEYKQLSAQYDRVTASARRGDSQLKKLDRTIGDNFRNVGNYQSALTKLNSVMGAFGVGFGLTYVIGGIRNFLDESIHAYQYAKEVLGQVDAGLKSTGNKVGFTIEELQKQAYDLRQATQIDDDKILQEVTAILVTFTSIRGQVFKDAQQSVLDLSTRMGGDLKSASVQIGKALNDPIKGITALKRVGVSFTATQQDMIKSLTETGRLEEAQAMILKELQTEFGGSAEAMAKADGGFMRLRNGIMDVQDHIGNLITHAVLPLADSFGKWLESITLSDVKKFVSILGTLGKVLLSLGRMWAVYKISTMAQVLANNALGNSFVKIVQRVGLAKASLMGLQRGFNSLKVAFASNPFGIIMVALTELYANWDSIVGLFDSTAGKTKELTDEQIAYRESIKGTIEYSKAQAQFVSSETAEFQKLVEELKNTNYGTKERAILLEKINSKYHINLKNIAHEGKFQEQLNGAVAEYIALKEFEFALKKNADRMNDIQEKKYKEQLELKKLENDLTRVKIRQQQESQHQDFLGSGKTEQEIKSLESQILRSEGAISRYDNQLKNLVYSENDIKNRMNELTNGGKNWNVTIETGNGLLEDENDELDENGKKKDKNKKSTKDLNTEFKKTNEYLSKQEELLNKIDDIEKKRVISDLENRIQAEVDLQKDKVTKTGEFDLNEFKRLVDEKYKLEVNRILDQATFEQDENEKKYQREKQARLDALNEEYAELKKNAGTNAEAIGKIDANYLIEKQKLADSEKLIYSDMIEENKIKSKEATDDAEALEKSRIEFTKSTNDELLNGQKEYLKSKEELNKESTDKDLEALKKAEEEKRAIINATADILTKQSEKRIEQIDNEMAKAEEQLEHYKQLAQEGNITAQQSLAEQQRIIDEANMKKEREQKRQQRIKLAESIYSTYSQKVENGSKNPLAETIRDTTLLQQFIASLPTFLEGTEDTGLNGKGIDGKGGFHAVLHPNERVIPKNLNEKIGSLSNIELTKIAQQYQNGQIMEGASQSASALEFSLLVSEIKDLKQVIKEKPETSIGLGEITQSMVEIVEKRVRGNSVTFNRFKVRK